MVRTCLTFGSRVPNDFQVSRMPLHPQLNLIETRSTILHYDLSADPKTAEVAQNSNFLSSVS
jgi:hypothetical protein